MPSKLDRLRAGEVVEFAPGRKGRLNVETKTLETSDGRQIYVGDDEDFFPSSPERLVHSQEKEKLKKDINKTPLGEFLFQFGNKGIVGGVKDWTQRLVNTGDEYLTKKRVESEVGEEISEKSPYTSGAATVASFLPDLALTRGMSALKAAPLIAGVSAGSRALDEPGQVAAETAIAAGGGYLLDKGANYLSKMASRRGLSRNIAKEGENVRLSNIAKEGEVKQANQQAKEAFQKEAQWAERENAARSHQYNLELAERQNQMLKSQQAYEQAKAAHSSNVSKLKEEAKLAQKSYEESVKKIPELQAQAQKEFSESLETVFKDIEASFPKGTKIPTNDLDVWGFYNNYVQQNGLVGTAEARQTQQLFRSLFPNNRLLTPTEFADRLRAVEAAIGKSSPESQRLLGEFKSYLAQKTPPILGEAIMTKTAAPLIGEAVQKEFAMIMNGKPFSGIAIDSSALGSAVRGELKSYVSSMSPKELMAKIRSGEFANDIRNKVLPYDKYESFLTNADQIKRLKDQGLYQFVKNQPEFQSEKAYEAFINNLTQRTENAIARTELEASSKTARQAGTAKGQLTRKLKKTTGMAEPVEMPSAPEAPLFPEAPSAPMDIPSPIKPQMVESPSAPIAQQFIPQQAPVLPAAQNTAETMGDFFEKPLLQGKGNMNNLLKLGALKYALGPAAVPLEAAAAGVYGAGKLLTSPGAVGQAARLSFKTAGIEAINQLAQKYPSYHDGILENPQERRSLTKEVEDDPEIPIEQKALIQSKINRGKSIFERLQ